MHRQINAVCIICYIFEFGLFANIELALFAIIRCLTLLIASYSSSEIYYTLLKLLLKLKLTKFKRALKAPSAPEYPSDTYLAAT